MTKDQEVNKVFQVLLALKGLMDLRVKKDLLDQLVTLDDLEHLVKMDHQGTLERRVIVAKMAYLGNPARKVL